MAGLALEGALLGSWLAVEIALLGLASVTSCSTSLPFQRVSVKQPCGRAGGNNPDLSCHCTMYAMHRVQQCPQATGTSREDPEGYCAPLQGHQTGPCCPVLWARRLCPCRLCPASSRDSEHGVACEWLVALLSGFCCPPPAPRPSCTGPSGPLVPNPREQTWPLPI